MESVRNVTSAPNHQTFIGAHQSRSRRPARERWRHIGSWRRIVLTGSPACARLSSGVP
ncbi:hypothetical protein CBM2623_B90028 [Cupriavidus taiwanensis]|nr:hypothetical protein CBM2623_B90028 [Cupriavidus taiwanensis]